ncbi:MAG: acyltransferase [Candidatus Saccharibacteria bacterium]|nr:acyltransferase [Candidatus Saccharibacteria bacterium]
MKLNKILKRLIMRHKADSEAYIKFLRKKGMRIGDYTVVYIPSRTIIDDSRPWLVEIGHHVKIAAGTTILTHGYDWSVLKVEYGEILGSAGKVKIGNNVFIGVHSTILKGVTIGNNVIIGANSLVNKNVPDNVVVAGNPAKVICSIDEYREKRKKKQLEEAVATTIEYKKVYGHWPEKKYLGEFVFLFENRTNAVKQDEVFNEIGSLNGNYDETLKTFLNEKGKFKSYDEFIMYCKKCLDKDGL